MDFMFCMIPHPAEYVNRRGFPHGGGNGVNWTKGTHLYNKYKLIQ